MAGLDPGEEADALRKDVVAFEVVRGRDVAGEKTKIESGRKGSAVIARGQSRRSHELRRTHRCQTRFMTSFSIASIAMSNSASPRSPSLSARASFHGSTARILTEIKSRKSLMTRIWSAVETGGRRENSLRKLQRHGRLATLLPGTREDERSQVLRNGIRRPRPHLLHELVEVEDSLSLDFLELPLFFLHLLPSRLLPLSSFDECSFPGRRRARRRPWQAGVLRGGGGPEYRRERGERIGKGGRDGRVGRRGERSMMARGGGGGDLLV